MDTLIKFNKIDNARRLNFNGSFVQIPKSKWGYLRKFKIYGNATQAPDPTPETPQPIKTVGTSTNVMACGENLFAIDATFPKTVQGVTVDYSDGVLTFNGTSTIGETDFYLTTNMNGKYAFVKNGDIYTMKNQLVGGSYTGNTANFLAYVSITKTTGGRLNYLNAAVNTTRSMAAPADGHLDRIRIYLSANEFITFNNYKIKVHMVKGAYTAETMPPYTPYIGSITPITFRDTNGHLHDLSSVPSGIRDEVNGYSESVDNIGHKTADGTESGWTISGSDIMSDYIRFSNDTLITNRIPETGDENGKTGRFLCSHFPPGSAWPSDTFYDCFSFLDTAQRIFIKIAKVNLAGYSPELTNAQKVQLFRDWLSLNPIEIIYVRTPKPWTLHPDERKKIITVDDTVCNVFTDSEVQPEMELNAISYGEINYGT